MLVVASTKSTHIAKAFRYLRPDLFVRTNSDGP